MYVTAATSDALESRIKSNLEKQQANYKRQMQLLQSFKSDSARAGGKSCNMAFIDHRDGIYALIGGEVTQ